MNNMRAKRFPITIILFWIILIFIAFLLENIALLSPYPQDGMGFKLFVSIFAITLIFVGIYLYYEKKYNNIKVDWLVLIIITAFFIINTIIILIEPNYRVLTSEGSSKEVVVTFSIKEKIIYILQLFVSLVMVYIFLVPYKKRAYSLKVQTWAYWLFVTYALIAVIFSFFLDHEEYVHFATPNAERMIKGVKSFYTNQNFYGFTMMMAVMTLMVIQIKRHRFYNTILMFVFFVAGIFSACSATVMISAFVFLLYYILDIINGLKKQTMKTIIRLLCVILGCFSFFITVMLLYDKNIPWVKTPVDFCILRFILDSGRGFLSFDSRDVVWVSAQEIIYESPLSIIFGHGFKVGSWLVHSQVCTRVDISKYAILTAHSSFYEIWVRFGLIGLALYAILIIDFTASCIYLFIKKERRFAVIFFICFLGMILHGIPETSIFFEGNTKGITITMFFFMPVLSRRYQYQVKGREELLNYRFDKEAKKLSFDTLSKITANVFMMVMVASIPMFASKLMYQGFNFLIFFIVFSVSAFITLFLCPFLHARVYRQKVSTSFNTFIRGIFVNNTLRIIITTVLGFFGAFVFSFVLPPSTLSLFTIFVGVMSAYFILWVCIKNDENRLLIKQLNNHLIYRVKRTISS